FAQRSGYGRGNSEGATEITAGETTHPRRYRIRSAVRRRGERNASHVDGRCRAVLRRKARGQRAAPTDGSRNTPVSRPASALFSRSPPVIARPSGYFRTGNTKVTEFGGVAGLR